MFTVLESSWVTQLSLTQLYECIVFTMIIFVCIYNQVELPGYP